MENSPILNNSERKQIREGRNLAISFMIVFGIITIAVFCSMVIPDIIEVNKWTIHNCRGRSQINIKRDCCGLSCSSSSISSCSTYLGVCSSNTLVYDILGPIYNNVTLTYQCGTDDFNCINNINIGPFACYMRNSDINSVSISGMPEVRNSGIIVVSVFGSLAIIALLVGVFAKHICISGDNSNTGVRVYT